MKMQLDSGVVGNTCAGMTTDACGWCTVDAGDAELLANRFARHMASLLQFSLTHSVAAAMEALRTDATLSGC